MSLADQYGDYGSDMLLNAADAGVDPDGAYKMEWPQEFAVIDEMVGAGLLTRRRDEVTVTTAGRDAAGRELGSWT